MKELDFSGISTYILKEAVTNCKEGFDTYGSFCCGINCDDGCPFYENEFYNCRDNANERRKEFKAELNRREKDMNKMPELKAGMIVELWNEDSKCEYGKYLYINDGWTMSLHSDQWVGLSDYIYPTKIYESKSKTLPCLIDNLRLIWSKKSDNDIKIEEIQNKMDDLKKELESLKNA